MMERQFKRIREGSLPGGDRRGMSGAGAGYDSIRTASGSPLNRRAGAGETEDTTAETQHGERAEDALQGRAISPTGPVGSSALTTSNAINDDRRRKWSTEETEELMFCFFKARSGGPGYIGRLQELFTERNPNNPKIHKFNGNTLSNQARRIIKQNVLSQELLDRIQRRAEEMTQIEHNEQVITTQTLETMPNVTREPNTLRPQSNTHAQNSPHTPHDTQLTPEQVDEIDQLTRNINVDEDQEPIILKFLQTLAETKDTPIEERLTLPKVNFTKQFIDNFKTLNNYLPNLLIINNSLREINDIIYATAKTLIENNNQKPYTPSVTIKQKREPPWKRRIQTKIEKLRKELGRLIEIGRGVNTLRIIKIRETLYTKYKIQNQNDHNNITETIKQKIKALAGRIKRYEEINTKKEQNKLFKENEHRLYRSLGGSTTKDIKIPSKERVEEFWTAILSNPKQYNTEAKWIKEVENKCDEFNTTEIEEITEDQVKNALQKLLNWKSPGIDKIQNYYLKYLTSTHKYLASLFTKVVAGTEYLEEWFTTGKVILIPKNDNTEDPKNWRPIACLPSMYKLLTSVLANILYSHCQTNNIMAEEQRGCRRGARGCGDHLMVNKAILEDAHQSQKNLSMAWIDYQKAFDSVSHEWLLKILDIYKCPLIIKRFFQMTMLSWRVIMTARGSQESLTTDPIYIRRGIFQGDSLSPLLFCMAINPLSYILNKYEMKGFKLKDSIWVNHLIYMDDLKVYANNRSNLKVLLHSVEIFTNDIGMAFGFSKCNVVHLSAGHRSNVEGEGHILLSGDTFKELAIPNRYKYLGIYESGKIEHTVIRDQITKEYFHRIKKLINTHLNSRNLIKGINTYAVPVLLYSFGVINYKNRDLKNIDIKTRKLLAIKQAQQQKAEVIRLYLPVNQGGRGLLNVEYMYKTQMVKYQNYLTSSNSHLVTAIVQHDTSRDKYSIIKEAQQIEEELNLPRGKTHTDEEIKKAIVKKYNTTWRGKPLHGQFPKKVLDQGNIDTELSFKWIKKQQISPSIESSIFAIQDQAVMTRQHQRDILREPVDGKCRLCTTKDETAQHIIAGCEKLAGTYYVKRHNNLVQYVHWCLARKHLMEVSNLWWKENLTQPQVKENSSAKILWEIPVQTDVTVTHNRPDLIYTDKINNKTYLIDITVPSDYNIGPKEIEKLSKYHLLKTEISRLWNTHTAVIPIVIGATGTVAKSIKKYIDKLDANIDIGILQKQAVIHTSVILSKVLGDTVFVNNTQDQTTQQSPNTQHLPVTPDLQTRGRGKPRGRGITRTQTIQIQEQSSTQESFNTQSTPDTMLSSFTQQPTITQRSAGTVNSRTVSDMQELSVDMEGRSGRRRINSTQSSNTHHTTDTQPHILPHNICRRRGRGRGNNTTRAKI